MINNVVHLFENTKEYKEQMLICGNNAVEKMWQDPDVLKALKSKLLERISSMSLFDMTYETGFKNRVMPQLFSDEEIQKSIREKFMEHINKDDIDFELGEALIYVLDKKLGV